MDKKESFDEIEKGSRAETFERRSVLKTPGGSLKSALQFLREKIAPVVLAVPLAIVPLSLAGCADREAEVENPGIERPSEDDPTENPDDTGIVDPGTEEPEEPTETDPETPSTNPGETTEEPGTEEPEEPTVDDPVQDISNLVVYVDEEGQSHVNMPLLTEATIDHLKDTVVLEVRIFDIKSRYETDDILFSNYNSTDGKLTIMWGGMDTESSSTYGFTILDAPVSFDDEDISSEDKGISIDSFKNNILGNLKAYDFESQNFAPSMIDKDANLTEKEQKIIDKLKTIASDNNRVDLNNLYLFFVTEVTSATPGQNLGICMGYRTYGIEKTDNQLILRGFSIYSSMQFGVQSDELVQHEANILNYENGGADWIGVAGDNRTVLLTMEDFYVPSSGIVEEDPVIYVLPAKKEEEKTL